jgi:hypothetical protein
MKRNLSPFAILVYAAMLVGALSISACGDDENVEADVVDNDTDDTEDGETFEVTCEDPAQTDLPIQRSPVCTLEDPAGWDPETPVPEGEVRAGQVRNDVRPFEGPEARCAQDDWIMQNDHIRVCIGNDSSNQLFFTGGRIIDIEDPDVPGHEFMEFGGTLFNLLEVTGDEIDLLSAGYDGRDAVLRVRGVDIPLKFAIGALGSGFLTPPAVAEIETEYRLSADSHTLEVVSWIKGVESNTQGDAGELMFPGDTAVYFAKPYGLGKPAANAEEPIDFFASIEEVSSYGVTFDDELNGKSPKASSTSTLLGSLVESIVAINATSFSLGEGEETVFRRWYAVGGPNTTDIVEAFRADGIMDEPDANNTTVTLTTDNDFAADARWLIETADGAGMGVVSIEDGSGSISLPNGDYRATPIRWPTTSLGEVTFTLPEDDTVTLPEPDAGYISASVEDDEGNAIPAKLRLIGAENFTHYEDGNSEAFAVPSGSWDIEVSYGEEYSVTTLEDVAVTTNDTTEIEATLTRQMDTTAWVSGDMHQHANRSPDSEVAAVNRVLANLVAGVDFFAPSDHDMIEDFAGIVEKLGYDQRMFVFQGIEISPVRAHMNAFPVPYRHPMPAGGGIPLSVRTEGVPRGGEQLTQIEMADRARELGAQVIQINHGRDSEGGGLSYFGHVEYDPVSGEPQDNELDWIEDVEAMEIINELGNICVLMRDWHSLLRHGKRITGTGTSDTHSLGAPSGFPRSYLFVGEEDEDQITDQVLVDALNAGRVSVSGNLFIDFTDGTIPGDEVSITGSEYTANLRIQSPEWTSASTLITYVNGIEVDRQTIDVADEELVDFDDTVTVELDGDSFVTFFVYGDEPMDQVTPGKRPVGFTNPVYVDVDGSGYVAPGVESFDDVPIPTGIPFCD